MTGRSRGQMRPALVWCAVWTLVFGLGTVAQARPAAADRTPLSVLGGSFWFHDGLPGSRVDTQAVVFGDGRAELPGLCPAAPATETVRDEVVEVAIAWRSCPGWRGSSAALVAQVGRDTLSVAHGRLTVDALDVQDQPVWATKGYGQSLRVVTYNVQMLPSTFNATTEPNNAARISERILAGGYDVVALNEVFDEDVQEVFVDKLDGEFPYHVDYLSGGTLINEDSGLMLFSRLPFDPLPDDTYSAENESCEATDCSRVAYREFQHCASDDCLSEKGVGFVRLRNPQTNGRVNVAFTHFQASYAPANYPDELEDIQDAGAEFTFRRYQTRVVNELLETTLGTNRLHSEPVLVMGDLNIDGDLANPDVGEDYKNVRNRYEWNQRTTADPDPCCKFGPIADSWAVDNAPVWPSGNFDRGITNIAGWGADADGARLDYILTNSAESRLCVQHMTLSHNLRWSPGSTLVETGLGPTGVGHGGQVDLSDHYGVNADINLLSPHCSPATARVLTPAPGQINSYSGTIGQPGQIRWVRIDEPGTYSFGLGGTPGIEYRVYESTNMTTPVPQYKQETTDVTVIGPEGAPHHFVGQQFRISKAPFFVRVWHTNRTETGDFTLAVLRHDCATRELACALAPAERQDVTLPASPPQGGADEKWFEFYTGISDNLKAAYLQDKALASEIDPAAAGYFTLELRRAGTPETVVGSDSTLEPDPAPQTPGSQKLVVPTQDTDPAKYYLVVKRLPQTPPPYPDAATHFQVRWETNLSILFGAANGGTSVQIRCLEENDGAVDDGDDEVYLDYILVDGQTSVGHHWLGDFDAGNTRSLEDILHYWLPKRFFAAVEYVGYESDGGLSGDDDTMRGTIPALAPGTPGPISTRVNIDPDTGGRYRLYYNITHGFDN